MKESTNNCLQIPHLKPLALIVLLFCSLGLANAEPFYRENLNILLTGRVEELITNIESEKGFSWEKNKINLGQENSEIYAVALMAVGNLDKAEKFLDNAIKRYPDDKRLQEAKKHIEFFKYEFDTEGLQITDAQRANVELIQKFPTYIKVLEEIKLLNEEQEENPQVVEAIKESEVDAAIMKADLTKLIKKTNNTTPYLPSRLDYWLELENHDLAEKEAKKIISDKRKILFPKTLDFYELSQAYRALAIVDYKRFSEEYEGDLSEKEIAKRQKYLLASKQNFQLSGMNIKKMRSIWLIEDIAVERPIMKTIERNTEFGYVIPQWIEELHRKFDNEYKLLLQE